VARKRLLECSFLVGWSALLVPACLTVLLLAFSEEVPWPWVFHPIGMLLLGWFMVIAGFWLDAPTSQDQLTKVLSGEAV
jgi:hypothetical protein